MSEIGRAAAAAGKPATARKLATASVAAVALAAAFLSCGRAPSEAAPAAAGADLIVYSSHPEELARLVISEFRERTGISVRLVQGGTGELLERLRAESAAGSDRAGRESCDVLWGGGAESLAANADLLEPCRSSEDGAIPAAYKAPDAAWTGFTVLPMVIVYNKRLLPPERAPKAWADLLEPRFRGRIAYADPAASGSAYTILRTATAALAGDPARGAAGDGESRLAATAGFARALAIALAGRVLPESSQVIPSVASGENLVGLSFENAAAETMAAGSDLGIVYPADGTSAVPDCVALVRGAGRREAAKRFIDFVLGPDVARVLAGRFGRRSARGDIPPPSGLPALSDLELLPYDIAAAAAGKRELVERFRAELAAAAE